MYNTVNYWLMPKVTFEVPPELKRRMDAHPEINWSSVFRQSIDRQSKAAEIAQQILDEQSDPRVQALAAALKTGAAGRYREAHRARRR